MPDLVIKETYNSATVGTGTFRYSMPNWKGSVIVTVKQNVDDGSLSVDFQYGMATILMKDIPAQAVFETI